MLSQTKYERYIHYRDHIQNNINNINYVRVSNCKYCKQERRDFYGSRFRIPNSMFRNNASNINLRNYNRIRNTSNILPETQNLIDNYTSVERYSPSVPSVERYSPSVPSVERYSPSVPNYYIDRTTTNGIYRIPYSRSIRSNQTQSPIIHSNSVPQRDGEVRPIILRNNYLNVEYFRNNLGIVPLPPEEIDDFEEFTDVEVKTLLETVNRTSELEVYYEIKREHCTICCENINYSQIVRKIKCGHIFHYKCIDEWLETNTKCPNCRLNLLNEG
jgi:hypothetical protein